MSLQAPAYDTAPRSTWLVDSFSTEGLTYIVSIDPATGLYRCGCPDHTYRHRDCKHIRSIQAIAGVRS
jgi:hypothetical protein